MHGEHSDDNLDAHGADGIVPDALDLAMNKRKGHNHDKNSRHSMPTKVKLN